jgi:hypothetical protein
MAFAGNRGINTPAFAPIEEPTVMERDSAPVSPPSSPMMGRLTLSKIVLDWDDTLLPTTQLADNYADTITGNARLPREVSEQLAALEAVAVKFLTEATALGHVTVITNARNGWVSHSGRLFIPKVLETLQSFGIEVIYARDKHGDVENADTWKMNAFCDLVDDCELPPNQTHLVSIGDSVFERNAAHYAAQQFGTASLKTVKFIDPWEGPTVPQLTAQLEGLGGKLRALCMQDKSVDMEMAFATQHALTPTLATCDPEEVARGQGYVM